ncbi:MAG: hypothetical protein RKO24_10960, partial [Candidatus Competibacter sp.]|nr:hypothetical protein [Candidatus Competibacter sp.]
AKLADQADGMENRGGHLSATGSALGKMGQITYHFRRSRAKRRTILGKPPIAALPGLLITNGADSLEGEFKTGAP